MAVSVTNLIQGPGTLYYGPFGQAEPLDSQVNGTPAASGWTDVGGTSDGVNLKVDQTWKALEVDQIVEVPGRRLTKREASIETNLAEPTLDLLAVSCNFSAPVTGAGYAYLEPGNDTSATQPIYRAFLFDGFAPGGFRRRVFLRRGLNPESVELAYKKDDQTVIKVGFAAHYVSASVKPFRIVDATA